MQDSGVLEIKPSISEILINEYHENNIKKYELKKREKEIMAEIMEKNQFSSKQIRDLEGRNKEIERIIENEMINLNINKVKVHGTEIDLKRKYDVKAKTYKKESLIKYIEANNLPIDIKISQSYDKNQLINYLLSNEYIESIHSITKEIESYITFTEDRYVNIKKIDE